MEIDGLPLHQLVNDWAVALVPLSVLLAWAFALLRPWRWLTRWGALLSALGGMAALFATWLTGRDLLDSLIANIPTDQPLYETLQTHRDRADQLLWLYAAFTVVVAVAFFLVPAPSRLEDGRLAFRGNSARWVSVALPALLVIVGLACLVWVALTGHAGAQAAFG
jgi:ABC-type multidrug transport system fused ATPase/permease subunit